MRVLLKRTLYTGGVRYPARRDGVDIPEGVELPRDALVWDGKKFNTQDKAPKREPRNLPTVGPDIVSAEMYRAEKTKEEMEGTAEVKTGLTGTRPEDEPKVSDQAVRRQIEEKTEENRQGQLAEQQNRETEATRRQLADRQEAQAAEEKAAAETRDKQAETKPSRTEELPTVGRSEPRPKPPKA